MNWYLNLRFTFRYCCISDTGWLFILEFHFAPHFEPNISISPKRLLVWLMNIKMIRILHPLFYVDYTFQRLQSLYEQHLVIYCHTHLTWYGYKFKQEYSQVRVVHEVENPLVVRCGIPGKIWIFELSSGHFPIIQGAVNPSKTIW